MPAFPQSPFNGMTLAALVFLSLGLAGCDAVSHYTPAPAALQDKVDCLATTFEYGPLTTAPPGVVNAMGSLPKNFVPVDVVRCGPAAAPAGTTTTGRSVLEEHFSGNYGPLLAALAGPSDRQDSGSCPAMAPFILDLWLVNADAKSVHVKWPVDVCGFPKPGVKNALAGLTVASTKILSAPAAP